MDRGRVTFYGVLRRSRGAVVLLKIAEEVSFHRDRFGGVLRECRCAGVDARRVDAVFSSGTRLDGVRDGIFFYDYVARAIWVFYFARGERKRVARRDGWNRRRTRCGYGGSWRLSRWGGEKTEQHCFTDFRLDEG